MGGTAPNLYTTKKGPTVPSSAELVANDPNIGNGATCTGYVDEDGCTVDYFTTATKHRWNEGQAACQAIGLEFAEVRDAAEDACFGTLPAQMVWLGGYKLSTSNSAPWKWVTSGKTVGWNNFVSTNLNKKKMIIWAGHWPRW